jgi:NAD+ kinase
MHVGVVAQQDNPRAAELADRIRRNVDASVSLDAATAESLDREGMAVGAFVDCDLVVSIGGDGTFLFAAREVTPTPVMGVNLGEVGFLNAVSPGEAVEVVQREVKRFERGDRTYQELPQVQAEGDGWSLPAAVNEVSILGPQRGRNNGVGTEVRVDGQLYSGSRADGVLVSTPTGSTAYNLSEGGPLVHPDVATLVVTEMCAEGPMPSLAAPLDADIVVRVEEADHAFVVADGRTRQRVDPPTNVRLRRADDPVRIAGPPLEFFTALGKLA